ncbi:MAG: aldehyde dehydrogenase family protein [Rubrivivax sp.]
MRPETSQERLSRIFGLQKHAFDADPCPGAQTRIERMNRIPAMLRKHREAVLAALAADFHGHSRDMGDLIEITGMFDRAQFNAANVKRWMKPVRKATNPVTMGKSKAWIQYQPKGVVGNMVSWNFPFDIGLGPTLDALGAGNRVIIKPSDLSPECGRVLQQMIADTFDESEVAVVNGDLELAKYFATLPWDHLVYTGSGAVGREVMKAAAANLVPVTLELGGKCPTIIGADKVADPLTIATVAGIKAIKRGQMCVTPDYCLVPESGLRAFTEALSAYMQQHFSADNGAAVSTGIISERHLARLQHLVRDARDGGAEVITIGSALNAGERHMPFHLVVNPARDRAVMREEIFGPILPIVTYRSTREVIDFVQRGDRPLGLYVFSGDPAFVDEIVRKTQSGGVAINCIAIQAAIPSMGFGGIGPSGMGRHHGEEGFREFSNPRGFFERKPGSVIDWITPPYGADTRNLIDNVAYASVGQQLKFALPRLVKNLFAAKP